MAQKIRALMRFILDNFGPIVVFYAVNHFFGLKPAIAVSTAYSFFEIAWKLYRKEEITGIFKFSVAMTLAFGVIDLYAQQSFLFKYEATVTNVFTAAFFGSTLLSPKTILQEFYEKREDAKPITRDRAAYFRLLTWVWVLYFLAKAAAYFWIARHYSIEEGLLVRTILGSGSFYAMLFLSIFGSKKIFPVLKKWGVLPEAELVPQPVSG